MNQCLSVYKRTQMVFIMSSQTYSTEVCNASKRETSAHPRTRALPPFLQYSHAIKIDSSLTFLQLRHVLAQLAIAIGSFASWKGSLNIHGGSGQMHGMQRALVRRFILRGGHKAVGRFVTTGAFSIRQLQHFWILSLHHIGAQFTCRLPIISEVHPLET
jgi:hypothetical protein